MTVVRHNLSGPSIPTLSSFSLLSLDVFTIQKSSEHRVVYIRGPEG